MHYYNSSFIVDLGFLTFKPRCERNHKKTRCFSTISESQSNSSINHNLQFNHTTMRVRAIRRPRLSSSLSSSSTDSESSKASLASFFKSRPFNFQKKSSGVLLVGKKSVSFAPLVSVVRVQSYVEDTKQELWYSNEDIQTMKKNNYMLVNQYRSGYFFESNTNTFLGLEQYLFLKEARFRRDCLYSAVLSLQNHWKEKSHPSNAERIARVYRKVLRRSVVSE